MVGVEVQIVFLVKVGRHHLHPVDHGGVVDHYRLDLDLVVEDLGLEVVDHYQEEVDLDLAVVELGQVVVDLDLASEELDLAVAESEQVVDLGEDLD